MPQFDTATWHEQIEQFRQRNQIPGMAVAVAEQGQTLLAQGFGQRNREAELPATAETVFACASVTKSFTALAIMQLQDAGKLSVEQPVTRWLPEFRSPNPEWAAGMTIHHFLTHTSGLPGMQALFHARAGSIARDPNRHRLGLVADPTAVTQIQTYEELLALMAESEYELLGPPGTWFNYSNEAYALLQGIIERASDRPFLEYMQGTVLHPLQMGRSAFTTKALAHLEPVTELYAAQAVNGKLDVFHAPGWWDVGAIYTNGSLKSSVLDLLRYLEIYRTGGISGDARLLSEAGVRQMMTPHVTTPTGRHYGYGLQVQPDYHGVTLVGHSGSIKGAAAYVMVAPGAGLTLAALTNLDGPALDAVALGTVNLGLGLDWASPRQEYPPFPVDAGALHACAGTYRNREGEAARATVDEFGLAIWIKGLPLRTRPIGPDTFLIEATDAPIRFLRSPAGAVTALFLGVRVLTREEKV